MSTQGSLTSDTAPNHEGRRRTGGSTRPGGPSRRKLRQIYVGEREMGHPVILVVGQDAIERLPAPASGGFGWGWPSTGASRRLAQALLVDLTGHEPPPEVRDALVTQELAHLPWTSFTLTGQELLGWIQFQGYTIADWPPHI